MRFIRKFNEITRDDLALVGGKALSLGLLTQADLAVPSGFCVTTDAFLEWKPEADLPEPVCKELVQAYREMGAGLVAVRSSATGEDTAAISFAGQQETILGVEGEAPLLDAVRRCYDSLQSARATAYRSKQDISGVVSLMAVVIQRLVSSEISGVLFTRDPLDPTGERMLVEASWGLGESVVSGRVMPDRFHLHRTSGELLEKTIHSKKERITARGVEAVPAEFQDAACLNQDQLQQLTVISRKIEEYYGDARDVEWAWALGQFWVLQARPITTAGAFEREQFRRAEIARLGSLAAARGTAWARYNLAEILPAPTPMTWEIVRKFMSGRGGYGLMLRDLGFHPDPIIDELGFNDLVCGRVYVNLSREPRLYFRDLPQGHSFATLKANPERAFYPVPTPDPEGATLRFFLRFPAIMFRMLRNQSRMKKQSRYYADHLRENIFPKFHHEVRQACAEDWRSLSPIQMHERFQFWTNRTLNEFARESLRPSVFAALAMQNVERGLLKGMTSERAAAAVRGLLTGVQADTGADLASALETVAAGELSREDFLLQFGHRGHLEMELAQPRWGEAPESLPLTGSSHIRSSRADFASQWQAISTEAKLTRSRASALECELTRAREYSGLRETAKHFFMMGYTLIRRALKCLDDHFRLNGGVFFLTPDELPSLLNGSDVRQTIHDRRKQRQTALSFELPPVIFSDDLEAIGRPPRISGATELKGIPLAAGVAEGTTLVLESPTEVSTAEKYVLVCPSTDPAWVPLFLGASALLMESGGVLSHGAIVAREFGLPAVAGLPGIQQRLRTGQRVRVDGNTGTVHIFD